MNHFLLFNKNTLTYPKTIFPPVCLEWPLFTQLMEGGGWPDTSHSSTTRAPTGTVNTWGRSFTDGGAARNRKEWLLLHTQQVQLPDAQFGGFFEITHPAQTGSLFWRWEIFEGGCWRLCRSSSHCHPPGHYRENISRHTLLETFQAWHLVI